MIISACALVVEQIAVLNRKERLFPMLAAIRRNRLQLLMESLVEVSRLLEPGQPFAQRRGHGLGQSLASLFRQAARQRMGLRVFDIERYFYPTMSLFLPYLRPRHHCRCAWRC